MGDWVISMRISQKCLLIMYSVIGVLGLLVWGVI